ncbi:MAG: tetraacyldisaccharide 4'-kinase [Rhodoferax sp.]
MPDGPRRTRWRQTLTQAWSRRGPLAWLLWPVSLLYRGLVALRRVLYRHGWLACTKLPVPVVVVGNVVAGGAGKTPVVIALAEHWQQRGIRVGVISRGYGRSSRGCREVSSGCRAQEVGDEPALIQRRTGAPVFVAARRAEAATALLASHPQTQVILSDDGLQHLGLQRDLEIGVFDDRGVGNGFLLPAGPLREPWPRQLDLLLHTGAQPMFAGFRGQRSLARYALRSDGSRLLLKELAQSGTQATASAAAGLASASARPILALAAIAQPEVFFTMLRDQGLLLDKTLALPDHADFDSWLPNEYQGYTLICTEKDALKLWPLAPQALAVPLELVLPEAFWAALDTRLDALMSAAAQSKTLSSRHGHTTT